MKTQVHKIPPNMNPEDRIELAREALLAEKKVNMSALAHNAAVDSELRKTLPGASKEYIERNTIRVRDNKSKITTIFHKGQPILRYGVSGNDFEIESRGPVLVKDKD